MNGLEIKYPFSKTFLQNPAPDFNYVKAVLPTLAKLLHYNDKDILADTCWAFSYLTDGSNEKIQAVIDTGKFYTTSCNF